MSVRVITCSDPCSAAWKQMMWCSEIRVFSDCIRLFFLSGWPGGPALCGRHLLFVLPNLKFVRAAYASPQVNPAQTALQGTQVPSRIYTPSRVSQELLTTGICNQALLPRHCSWCTFSNFFTFLFLAAVKHWRVLQKQCLTVWLEGPFPPSIRGCSSCKDVWTSQWAKCPPSNPSSLTASIHTQSHSQWGQVNSKTCNLRVDCSSFVIVWAWHKPLLAKPFMRGFQRQCLIEAVWEFTSPCWEKFFCAGIAKPRCTSQTQLARPSGCRINGQGRHGLRPLGWVNCNICWDCFPLNDEAWREGADENAKATSNNFWTSVRKGASSDPFSQVGHKGVLDTLPFAPWAAKGQGHWAHFSHTFNLCSSAHRAGRSSLSSGKLDQCQQCWCKVEVTWPSVQFWCTLHQIL